MSGDSVEKVYEAYGSANEEKKYDNGDGLLEVNYIKDHQKLSFVVDEESKTVEYIYIYYYIEGQKQDRGKGYRYSYLINSNIKEKDTMRKVTVP